MASTYTQYPPAVMVENLRPTLDMLAPVELSALPSLTEDEVNKAVEQAKATVLVLHPVSE
jgi:hypothetical protein